MHGPSPPQTGSRSMIGLSIDCRWSMVDDHARFKTWPPQPPPAPPFAVFIRRLSTKRSRAKSSQSFDHPPRDAPTIRPIRFERSGPCGFNFTRPPFQIWPWKAAIASLPNDGDPSATNGRDRFRANDISVRNAGQFVGQSGAQTNNQDGSRVSFAR